MFLPILLVLAMQADVLRPDLPPSSGSAAPVLSPSVASHYKDGLSVYGTLQFPDNTQQKTADIELFNSTGLLIEKHSSANSQFQFDKVPLGIYYIDVLADGIEVSRRQLVLTENDFGKVEISIELHRKPGAAKDPEPVLSAARTNQSISKDAIREFDKATEAELKGVPTKAIPHLEKAIKLSPDYFEANLQLGLDDKQVGKADAAIPFLKRAIELNPASAPARLALGQLYFEKERFQEAVAQLQEEIRVGNVNAEAFFTLGESYYKLDQLGKAEENLRQSLKISEQTMGKAHLELYNVYMKGHRPNQALAELNVYLERYPNGADRQMVQALADKLRKQRTP